MKDIPIHECFYTWQGEGIHMGRAAYFIRSYGCPLHCPWCDSAGTWHPQYKPVNLKKYNPQELALNAKESGCEFVVITGGEPAIHNLTALSKALRDINLPVHIETSGAFKLQGNFDWITVSPKWSQIALKENIEAAHEIKLIIENPESIKKWLQVLPELYNKNTVWLHPEWSQRENPEILEAISQHIKENKAPFRAGYQLHKLYNVDALDENTAPLVPLGGNETLGY